MSVTLKNIAEHAQVSRPAVSLFLNDSETKHVSAENKKKIMKAIDELGYRPNYAARSLRGGASMTIGIAGGMFSVPVHDAITNALMQELWKQGYQVILGENAHDDKKLSDVCAELESRNVDALIITSAVSEKEKEKISVPYISVTHNQANYDIAVDMEYGGHIAGKHLIEHGHRRISYITNGRGGEGRFRGLERALCEAGLESGRKFRIDRMQDTPEKGILRLVNEGNVTAFFCINDFTAAAVLSELKSNGISVPGDVAIVGFDGLPFTEFTSPVLTTVVQPVRDLAEASIKLLLDKIKGKIDSKEKTKLIKPYLATGGSCGCKENPAQNISTAGTKLTLDYFS
jgi:DNA-binding LacI/PurR family transcriptional regulator